MFAGKVKRICFKQALKTQFFDFALNAQLFLKLLYWQHFQASSCCEAFYIQPVVLSEALRKAKLVNVLLIAASLNYVVITPVQRVC